MPRISTRRMVTEVMPAIVKILKARFPNLTAEEAVKLAGEISDAVLNMEDDPIDARLQGGWKDPHAVG